MQSKNLISSIFFVFISLLSINIPAYAADDRLRIALLPILDSLPFYFARETGIMKTQGFEAEALPVASAIERNQLMQSGGVDGMLTEIVTTASFNRKEPVLKIVRNARTSYPDYPLFRLLSSPGSTIRTPRDLKGNPVAIARNTIIEYVTDRLLKQKGIKEEDITKQSVPVIPERFQLLMQGRIKAATLPDPLAGSAMAAGAIEVVADSDHPRCAVSVLAFTAASLNEKADAVRSFLAAWDESASRINQDPEAARAIMLQAIPFPANIRDVFKIPTFPRNGIPDKDQWDDVINWMLEKRLIDTAIAYNDSVTDLFLRRSAKR